MDILFENSRECSHSFWEIPLGIYTQYINSVLWNESAFPIKIHNWVYTGYWVESLRLKSCEQKNNNLGRKKIQFRSPHWKWIQLFLKLITAVPSSRSRNVGEGGQETWNMSCRTWWPSFLRLFLQAWGDGPFAPPPPRIHYWYQSRRQDQFLPLLWNQFHLKWQNLFIVWADNVNISRNIQSSSLSREP